jgi:hypothetical protein
MPPPLGACIVCGEGQVVSRIFEKLLEKRRALRSAHVLFERACESLREAQRNRDVDVPGGELLEHDARSEHVRACAAGCFGYRKRAQTHPRRVVEQLGHQWFFEWLQPRGVQRSRLDFVLHEVFHRVAELHLFGSEMQIEHGALSLVAWRSGYHATSTIQLL